VEEGILPHIRSISDMEALEEERRLMYVAMTRAKERLYVSRAKERFQFGEYMRNLPSRFIEEIPTEFITELDFEEEKNYFNSFSRQKASLEEKTYSAVKKPKLENKPSDFSV